MTQLVFIHGRAQERKDSIALKGEWLKAWKEGLAKSGLALPLTERDIRFPYYGDTLDKLVEKVPPSQIPEVVIRGNASDPEQQFMRSMITRMAERRGVTQAQIAAASGIDVAERAGVLNWKWVHGILKAIDRHVPLGSGTAIALFTHDVYVYLRNRGVSSLIDRGVREAFKPGEPTVVVAHSLGTVVAYSVLRDYGAGWRVPLFVTVGSPLAVAEIYDSLKPVQAPPCCAGWYNALDPRDVVALYPLDKEHFDVDPAITNKKDVRNDTPNCHGISGYLTDKDVARRIYDAVTM